MLHFLGIGAQKAGTTWLYHMLARHPELSFPAGKEIHFWNRHYHRGTDWYRGLFSKHANQFEGEITPAYANLALKCIRECRGHFPDIRLIYLIRNPIERAWSSALMALHRSEMTLGETSDQWFIDHFNSAGSKARGDYAGCIAAWTAVYPADQLLIRPYELLSQDPRKLLADICEHIGVAAESLLALDDTILFRRCEPVQGVAKARIRPGLLPHLRQLYYPGIQTLSELLDQDFSHWRI